jgi:hypothetical protein
MMGAVGAAGEGSTVKARAMVGAFSTWRFEAGTSAFQSDRVHEPERRRKQMQRRRTIIVLVASLVFLTAAAPALAYVEMAYEEKQTIQVASGSSTFAECASVAMTAPKDGYVMVTATGFAFFNSTNSNLVLALGTASASAGPSWAIRLNPGANLEQSFAIRTVFPVQKKQSYTFYLNGVSETGGGGNITVHTGTITAEFFKKNKAQAPPL